MSMFVSNMRTKSDFNIRSVSKNDFSKGVVEAIQLVNVIKSYTVMERVVVPMG